MMNKLKKALTKSLHNPRHFWYLLQNINFLHNYFPTLYWGFKLRKNLKLGSSANLKALHVILRTTDSIMHINASRQLENIGVKTKNDVIRVGGCSLFPAAANFAATYGKQNLRITIVVDRLSEAGMQQYRYAAKSFGLEFDVVSANGHGNGPTFQTQIDIALRDADDTLILILEDDYKLDEAAFTTCFKVMKDHSNVIGMNPHFHPDRVRFQDIGRLAVIDRKLFCRVHSTCCTFFMPAQQLRRFKKSLRLYDGYETGSVGCAWKKGICLAPLGWTLAEHLHRSDLSPTNSMLP